VFEKTRKPLLLWFNVAWEITNSKQGANALTIQRRIGLPSYKTAWSWLHKFRRAMVRPDRDRLTGEVEVDETYVGGQEDGVRGRRTKTKSIVVIAVELRGNRPGRVRLRKVQNVSAKSLVPFVTEVIEPGSVVKTDGWSGYTPLNKENYTHDVSKANSSESPDVVVMPKVHLVAALLKRWLLGTFHGGVSREHLPYYLDEFTFRFNRRTSRARGLLFYRLVEQAVSTTHTSTHEFFLGAGRGPVPRILNQPDHKM
jgi:transposase-like protein